jgi:hypothetical protein
MKKTWKDLLAEGRVEKLAPDKTEIQQLWALARRNLSDAESKGLSPEGKFEFAYNAARTLATIVIRTHGYRIKSSGGHHWTTFVALEVAMGSGFATTAAYFDQCRKKRNDALYDTAKAITEAEANELLLETKSFSRGIRSE